MSIYSRFGRRKVLCYLKEALTSDRLLYEYPSAYYYTTRCTNSRIHNGFLIFCHSRPARWKQVNWSLHCSQVIRYVTASNSASRSWQSSAVQRLRVSHLLLWVSDQLQLFQSCSVSSSSPKKTWISLGSMKRLPQ